MLSSDFDGFCGFLLPKCVYYSCSLQMHVENWKKINVVICRNAAGIEAGIRDQFKKETFLRDENEEM